MRTDPRVESYEVQGVSAEEVRFYQRSTNTAFHETLDALESTGLLPFISQHPKGLSFTMQRMTQEKVVQHVKLRGKMRRCIVYA